jgi:tetratricopeptide (TPR) repeat protein
MAIDNYKTAIRLKPDWELPLFNLGKIYLKKGDNEKARREFEKVLQVNPQYYEARKFLNSIN